mmetsp:Transcript_6788/g.9501  ORF Transcript_6788/g.9501 Transcript_6788/m.9501 type:complete len:177 (+) Transcript_6788:42-572(+)
MKILLICIISRKFVDSLNTLDVRYMRLALEEAREAGARKEVPIGAVLVDEEKQEIIASGRNSVEELLDASAHAEIMCLRAGANQIGNWRLLNLTLFCTVEPCPMCLSAAYAFRVRRLVYGAPDLRLGAVSSWIQLPRTKHPFHDLLIEGGILEEESAQLLRDFFRERRIIKSPAAS